MASNGLGPGHKPGLRTISGLRNDYWLQGSVWLVQHGHSIFPEFLEDSWRVGGVRYDVNFAARTVAYCGCNGEEYIEAYPAVEVG